MPWWFWLFLVIVLLGAMVAAAWRPARRRLHARGVQRACRAFRRRREHLEAKFFDLAAASGKPRGLRWVECQWHDAVTFVRDRHSRMLTALVGVTIRFEAVEGGEMEGVEAVGNLKDATAVFHCYRGRWGTGGRALFNMTPAEAVARLAPQFEPVAY